MIDRLASLLIRIALLVLFGAVVVIGALWLAGLA